MKKTIRALFTLLALAISTQTIATIKLPEQKLFTHDQEIIRTHNTIRSVYLRMQLDEDLHGIVESKNCSFCRTIKINVTPTTAAYKNNVKVPLEQAKTRIGRNATIIYNLKTNNVSAIRW